FQIGKKGLLCNSQLNAHKGIIKSIRPKLEVSILNITRRTNLNRTLWDRTPARHALQEV
ncbi:hypothetical protein COCC4DRAFT_155553, partial [Bipolaris maydis ATCC 48331]